MFTATYPSYLRDTGCCNYDEDEKYRCKGSRYDDEFVGFWLGSISVLNYQLTTNFDKQAHRKEKHTYQYDYEEAFVDLFVFGW